MEIRIGQDRMGSGCVILHQGQRLGAPGRSCWLAGFHETRVFVKTSDSLVNEQLRRALTPKHMVFRPSMIRASNFKKPGHTTRDFI